MRSQKMLIGIILCLCLSVVVSAHSGKTDSDGGHIDHGSGEYHYHHGYSAHQHSDMDGDGYLDCPYSFDDKTGSSQDNAEPVKKGNSKKSMNYFIPIICYLVLFGLP